MLRNLKREIAQVERQIDRDKTGIDRAREALRAQFQRKLASPMALMGSFLVGWFVAALHRPSHTHPRRASSWREKLGPALRLAPLALRLWMRLLTAQSVGHLSGPP